MCKAPGQLQCYEAMLPVQGSAQQMQRDEAANLWCHLGLLIGLGVQPAQGLQVTQVVMLRQVVGQVDHLVVAPLRRHHHTPDLLHLRVVRWTHAIKVP